MSSQEYLFVYGTLRQGFRHVMRELMLCHSEFVGCGSFQGLLFDLIQYPGVVRSENATDKVHGEIYSLADHMVLFKQLDESDHRYARSSYG